MLHKAWLATVPGQVLAPLQRDLDDMMRMLASYAVMSL